MTFERIPPSPLYDRATGRLIGRAIASPGQWQVVSVPRPEARGLAVLARLGIAAGETDSGGLAPWERAYQRSMYYVLNGGGGKRNPTWSLQRRWGDQTAQGRLLAVRVTPVATARRAVNRKPKSEQWYRNPELRSGGAGSPKQRFG